MSNFVVVVGGMNFEFGKLRAANFSDAVVTKFGNRFIFSSLRFFFRAKIILGIAGNAR